MKRLLVITALLMFLPVASALNMQDYPDLFIQQGDFDGLIVVGEAAPSQDVASAINLIPSLQAASNSTIRSSTLDSEVDDHDLETNNIISIGNACDNTVTRRIMDIDDCDEHFRNGRGYIYLYKSDLGRAWLVIAGGTPDDTEKAAIVVGKHKEYDLIGNAIEILGDAPYELSFSELPDFSEPEPRQIIKPPPRQEPEEEPEEKQVSERQSELEKKIERYKDEPEPEFQKEEQKVEEKDSDEGFLTKAWNGFKKWILWFFQ